MVFPTFKGAMDKIEKLKSFHEKDYFEGTFSIVAADFYIFEFAKTLRASDATSDTFGVTIIERDADSIAPPCDMTISLNIDICDPL